MVTTNLISWKYIYLKLSKNNTNQSFLYDDKIVVKSTDDQRKK